VPFDKARFEKIQTLPPEIKDFFLSEGLSQKVDGIAEKHGIGGKFSKLNKLVGDVLLGELTPENITQAIVKELKLDNQTSLKITQDIKEQVLYQIKDNLEQLYSRKFDDIRPPSLEKFEYVPPPKPGEVEMAKIKEEEKELRERKPLITPAPDEPIRTAEVPKTEAEALEKKKKDYGESQLPETWDQRPEVNGQIDSLKKKESTQRPEIPEPEQARYGAGRDQKPKPKKSQKPDKYRQEPNEEELEPEKRFGKVLPKVPPVDTHIIDLKDIDKK
jgi:hypothetical protein